MKITRSQLAQIITEELGELNEETEAWRRNAAISKIEQFFLDVRGYSAAHEDAEVPVLFDEDWGEIVGRGGAMDQLENVRWLNKPLTRCPISRPDDGHRPKADELPRDCEERIEYNQKESYEALRARIEVVDNQWDLAIGKNKSIMQWITSPAGDRYLRMISTLVDDLIWLPDTGPNERPGNVGSSGMSVSPLPTDPPIPTFQDRLMEMIRQELREEATITDTGVVEEGTQYSYEKALIDAGRYTRAQLDDMSYADIQAAWNELDQEAPADL